MATLSAIARPYAQAAYEFAQAKNELPVWSIMLQTAAQAIEQPQLYQLIANTRISSQQWFSLLSDILKPYLDESRKNFLRMVTENRRVSAFPEISMLFRDYEILNKQTSEVQVTTAFHMDEKQKQSLAKKLTEFLKYRVNLLCEVDENILGGVVIRAGDKVIDGSIRGQLSRLLEFAIR